jgi:hypothetical protein
MEASTRPQDVVLSAQRAESRFREVIEEVDVAAEEIISLLSAVGAEFHDTAAAMLITRSDLLSNTASRLTQFPVRALADDLDATDTPNSRQARVPPLFESSASDSQESSSTDNESSDSREAMSGDSSSAGRVQNEPSTGLMQQAPPSPPAAMEDVATAGAPAPAPAPTVLERGSEADIESSALDRHQLMVDGGVYDSVALALTGQFDPGGFAAEMPPWEPPLNTEAGFRRAFAQTVRAAMTRVSAATSRVATAIIATARTARASSRGQPRAQRFNLRNLVGHRRIRCRPCEEGEAARSDGCRATEMLNTFAGEIERMQQQNEEMNIEGSLSEDAVEGLMRSCRYRLYREYVASQFAEPLGSKKRVRLPRCVQFAIRKCFPNPCCVADRSICDRSHRPFRF